MHAPRTLEEALASLNQHGPYPADQPQTVAAAMDAEPGSIKHPFGLWLRAQGILASRRAGKHRVTGPKETLELLSKGYALHPWSGCWATYALTADKEVHMVAREGGGVRSLRITTHLIPKVDDLPDLPRGTNRDGDRAAWFVLYGGTPEVLSKPHVAKGLATLQRRVPVADIAFYVGQDQGVTPTLWSVHAGFGVAETGGPAGTKVPFPDLEALAEVRNA